MTHDADELDRLMNQEAVLPLRRGFLRIRLDVDASAPGDVLRRVREVIGVVLERPVPWPDRGVWGAVLPRWFVAACAPEITREEALRQNREILALPPADAAARIESEAWSLSEWLYWMHPDERPWSWSSATVREGSIDVEIDVDDLPVPLGAFEWTFRAAGASSISTDHP